MPWWGRWPAVVLVLPSGLRGTGEGRSLIDPSPGRSARSGFPGGIVLRQVVSRVL